MDYTSALRLTDEWKKSSSFFEAPQKRGVMAPVVGKDVYDAARKDEESDGTKSSRADSR